jgi:DNA-binding NtrC family response regulator
MNSILIVDDEAPIRLFLRKWLEKTGLEIREAEDSASALAAMEAAPAGVVFSDVQMPGRDGLWLTAEIRRRFPHTAVVLATGVTTVPPSVSLRAGVLAYLVKPLAQARVMAALETARRWHTDTVAAGPSPEDVGDKLDDWLDSLAEL